MAITLYELAGNNPEKKFSPHCWKSRLALAHKQLPVESVPVRFTEKEKIAFSGQALVPVMVDGDETVTDSWEIACYLEAHYPDAPSLFGDAAGKALAESINHWCNNTLAPHIRPLILLDIFQLIAEKDKPYFRQSREEKIGMTLEAFSAKADTALLSFREALESVRELLSMQPYIGGQQPNYADICLLGTLLWIACVNDLTFIEETDIVYAWYQRMLDCYPIAAQAVGQS
jgi:glutathione S-transferase